MGDNQILRSGPLSEIRFSITRYFFPPASVTILAVPLVGCALLVKLPVLIVVPVGNVSFLISGAFFLQEENKKKKRNTTDYVFIMSIYL